MESESGAKIAIRGKGSVKEGKGRSDAAHSSNQEEDLHCLVMADTEEKIEKAKKLIANVIETVSIHNTESPYTNFLVLTQYRPRLSPKAKTNSSVTSCENLPHSTVLCETTRTRPARTVARLVTESTTALSVRTTQPASSAVSVVMQATWLVIVPTDREVLAGVMTALLVLLAESAVVMLLIVNMRYVPLSIPICNPLKLTLLSSNSCKTLARALLVVPSRLALVAVVVATTMPDHGNNALRQLVALHHGVQDATTTTVAKVVARPLLLGHAIAMAVIVTETTTETGTVEATITTVVTTTVNSRMVTDRVPHPPGHSSSKPMVRFLVLATVATLRLLTAPMVLLLLRRPAWTT